VAITGVAGGERETAMGSAAAEGPSLQVRGRWIKMAEALPRPASCVCVLLFTLLLCTRVRVVLVVVAAAVEFAVLSLSVSPASRGSPHAYAALIWLQTLAFLCLTLFVSPLPF